MLHILHYTIWTFRALMFTDRQTNIPSFVSSGNNLSEVLAHWRITEHVLSWQCTWSDYINHSGSYPRLELLPVLVCLCLYSSSSSPVWPWSVAFWNITICLWGRKGTWPYYIVSCIHLLQSLFTMIAAAHANHNPHVFCSTKYPKLLDGQRLVNWSERLARQ